MRVPRVAVRAAEGATYVWIDRPETHPRGLRAVEYGARDGAIVADILLLADHWKRTAEDVCIEESALLDLFCRFCRRHSPIAREGSDHTEHKPKTQVVGRSEGESARAGS